MSAARTIFATITIGGQQVEWISIHGEYGIWDGQRWIDRMIGPEEMFIRLLEMGGTLTSEGEDWLSEHLASR